MISFTIVPTLMHNLGNVMYRTVTVTGRMISHSQIMRKDSFYDLDFQEGYFFMEDRTDVRR